MPLNKYISGRVPAIFFTLICFCYFILLPAEFSDQVYQTTKPSFIFHLLINTLIIARLLLCLLSCKDNFWRYTFALLSWSAGFLLIDNIRAFTHSDSTLISANSYFIALMPLLPYFLLILAASITLKATKLPRAIEKENNPDLYILLLMLVPTTIHLYGYEQKLFYSVNSNLQSLVILFWLFVGSILLSSIAITRRSQIKKLHQNLFTEKNLLQQLSTQNNELTNALVNSEYKAIINASNNAILTTSQKNVAKLTQEPIEQSSLDDKFLHKLEALIAKHYTEPELDISLLAKELAMSGRQLQRKIKVILGITPNNFIKEFRLKKAQELLMSGAQIGRIALDVGFSSQTYFGRCFKESFNCTPKQYQRHIAQQDSLPDS